MAWLTWDGCPLLEVDIVSPPVMEPVPVPEHPGKRGIEGEEDGPQGLERKWTNKHSVFACFCMGIMRFEVQNMSSVVSCVLTPHSKQCNRVCVVFAFAAVCCFTTIYLRFYIAHVLIHAFS